MSKTQRELLQAEIEKMLRKGAIFQIDHTQGEYISSLFLVEKRDGEHRTVINLKNLREVIYGATWVIFKPKLKK